MHIPVLAAAWLQFLEGKKLKVVVDATFGAGGHAKCVLEAHPEIDHFYAFDQDPLAKTFVQNLPVELFSCNFCEMETRLGGVQVDAILMDLGVSSMQLDTPERGFSFMADGPLDMRMNPEQTLSAREVVNTWDEKDLAVLFRDLGEERNWRRAARAVVEARPMETTGDLVKALESVLGRFGKRHPATKVFQAIRMAVNRELGVVEETLPQALRSLKPGGLLGVITFHSLEDRLVKQYFQLEASNKENTSGIGGMFIDKEPTIITHKVVKPTDDDIKLNPRCRSSKLRVAQKL